MSVIQEHNLLSFQEFLFSEAFTAGADGMTRSKAKESGLHAGQTPKLTGKETKVNVNELYREYVNPKTGVLDIKSLAALTDDKFKDNILTLAADYVFDIDGTILKFIMPPKAATIKNQIKNGQIKNITLTKK